MKEHLSVDIDRLVGDNERFQLATKAANLGIWDWFIEIGEVYFSNIWKSQIGYKEHELENTFATWEELLHPDDREAVLAKVNDYLKKPEGYYVNEFRLRHKDGSYRWILARAEVLLNEKGEAIRMYGSHTDITTRVEVEQKFKAISNQTTEGIGVADMEGNYVFVNPAFCKMSGYSEEELLKLTAFDMKANNQGHQSFNDIKEKYEGVVIRVNLRKKDGTEYLTEIIGDVITVNGEQFALGTVRDISEKAKYEKKIRDFNESLESQVKKRTKELNKTVANLNTEIERRIQIENKMQEALELKEVLLKEITHRVKNNLQIICSLINLQKETSRTVDPEEMLSDISNRIYSMSLIHETLHKSDNIGKINFNKYIDSLIFYIDKTFDASNIEFITKIGNCSVAIGTATSCGLIIMELLTNSMKYAFPEGRKGKIEMSINHVKNNQYELSINDNGIGLPKDFDLNSDTSLGLQLVLGLVDQLDGTIEVLENLESGSAFKINFYDIKES